MSALVWERNEGYKVTTVSCGVCGRNKVRWWPSMAGWPLESDDPLVSRLGCCDGCKGEWVRVWERRGK